MEIMGCAPSLYVPLSSSSSLPSETQVLLGERKKKGEEMSQEKDGLPHADGS